MFEIPFFRFAVPCAILYVFFYALAINPPMEEDEHQGLSPEDVKILRWKGARLMEAQKYQEADEVYVKLHKEFSENSVYTAELAKIRHFQQHYEEEAALWESYMQHAPIPVEGCPQIGAAYRAAGDSAKTLDAMKRCYEFEPSNSDMILFYALELEHQGDKRNALSLYAKGHLGSPRYTDLTVGLARTESSMGDNAKARKLILEALEESPDNADALLAAGTILARSGDRESARRYLQHGVEVAPNYEEMRVAFAAMRGSRRKSRT
jgi:tetratricopeptide (TPR) repeat protein